MTGDARVGIVGLGLMGFALSARLVEAKIPLVGFDIDRASSKLDFSKIETIAVPPAHAAEGLPKSLHRNHAGEIRRCRRGTSA